MTSDLVSPLPGEWGRFPIIISQEIRSEMSTHKTGHERVAGPKGAGRAFLPGSRRASGIDYQAALRASEILSENGMGRDALRKFSGYFTRAFRAFGWGLLLTEDPFPQFDLFTEKRISDDDLATVCAQAMTAYSEFMEIGEMTTPQVHTPDRTASAAGRAELTMAWQMFLPTGFLGVVFLIGPTGHVPSEQEIRLFSFLSNQLAATIGASRLHRQLHSHVRKQTGATQESASGLLSKSYLQEEFSRELKRASRYGHSLACMLIDFSVAAGPGNAKSMSASDNAIQQLGRIVRDSIREVDMATQWGPNQFLLVLPDTDAPGAKVVAKRLLAAMVDELSGQPPSAPPTTKAERRVRICVTHARSQGETVRALLARLSATAKKARTRSSGRQIVLASTRA